MEKRGKVNRRVGRFNPFPCGHFCSKLLPGFPLTYLFSKSLNPLDYDPTYPKNPVSFGQHIRKYRKDKGLLIKELAERLGIHEFTLIKWEGGRLPRPKYLNRLKGVIPGLPAIATIHLRKMLGDLVGTPSHCWKLYS